MMIRLVSCLLCIAAVTDFAEKRRFVLSALREYSPTSYRLVQALERGRGDSAAGNRVIRWDPLRVGALSRARDEVGMALVFNAVVHAASHEYSSGHDPSVSKCPRGRMPIYSGTADHCVAVRGSFPSEGASLVPARFRGAAYRTHVAGKAPAGFYGLIDEFAAHYHGAKAAHDILRWYGKRFDQDGDTWKRFLAAVDSSIDAHQEFRLFILCHLRYAKNNKPDLYASIVGDAAFRKAFAETDRNWSRLAEAHCDPAALRAAVAASGEPGVSAPEGGGIMVRRASGVYRVTVPVLSSNYREILEELKKPEYAQVIKDISR